MVLNNIVHIGVFRQCSSGLQAIASVAAAISAGFYDIGIAGGVETMSMNPMSWDGGLNPKIATMTHTQGCLLPMGITSENVAAKFGISREQQDRFALASHMKAAAAQRTGKFKDEIVPVSTRVSTMSCDHRDLLIDLLTLFLAEALLG